MPHTNFDFDHWSQLARQDPAVFFAERELMINAFISSAPPEHHEMLREMQRMIDGTRAEAGTPMKAVRQMMGMMADRLDAMRGQLQQLREESEELVDHVSRIQQG
ncbi:MAG TPA: DUF3135 domain-containing protein [Rhodocyclaceae bacterium]|nr:DUF3135 domain-containing protein [Rhodocyclaceae bacterium]